MTKNTICEKLFLLILLLSCTQKNEVKVFTDDFPEKLSEWNLFTGRNWTYSSQTFPYSLKTALFSDYAGKFRTVHIPKGKKTEITETGPFALPAGTVITKTFYYKKDGSSPEENDLVPGLLKENIRLMETRVLVNTGQGWTPLPYIWDEEKKDAYLEITGRRLTAEHRGTKFDYFIPNANQCKTCHENSGETKPIGLKLRHFDREFQYPEGKKLQTEKMKEFTSAEFPKSAPDTDPARLYLDINCSHCHSREGQAKTSGLILSSYETDPYSFGVCRSPVAAGKGSGNLKFDIVPGNPEKSILYYRMNSIDPSIMMPELGRSIIHKEGTETVKNWIIGLRGNCGKNL
ncbi:MAG TPA: SO2930 family diheme c-type cytochrome [Leptospiraceae bacterium]|nr:SO2930 family diheme c-type cytochrome [Leptospiraceae bacterium]